MSRRKFLGLMGGGIVGTVVPGCGSAETLADNFGESTSEDIDPTNPSTVDTSPATHETSSNPAAQVEQTPETHEINGEFSKTPTIERDFTLGGSLSEFGIIPESNPMAPTWGGSGLVNAYPLDGRNVSIIAGEGLVIQPHIEHYVYPSGNNTNTYEITSGRVHDTAMHAEYGRWEWLSVTMPKGQGLFPAIWVVAQGGYQRSSDPSTKIEGHPRNYLQGSEIDVFEPDTYNTGETAHSTVHFFEESAKRTTATSVDTTQPQDYALELTPDRLAIFINDIPVIAINKPEGNPPDPALWPYFNNNRMRPIYNIAFGRQGVDVDLSRYEQNPQNWAMTIGASNFYEYNES